MRPPAPSPVGNRAVAAAALDGTLAASVERIARLAATVLGAPATLIALVGDDRRCFGGGHALPGGLTRDPGVLVRSGLYARAVDSGKPLALEDARLDESDDVAGAARALGIAGYLGMPLLDDDGNALGVFCAFDSEPRAWTPQNVRVLRDLSALAANELTLRRTLAERERVERQLRRDALHDPLTGLPNRTLFMDRLSLAVQRAQRSAAGEYVAGTVIPATPDRAVPPSDLFAVLFLDLDDFKAVNDSVGHHGGDELLVAVARRLEECIRGGDVAARFGGDEFAILLERVADARDAASVATRVQTALARQFNLSGYELFSSASIGVALSSSGNERAEYMLRSADMAMYRAKSAGRARFEVFDPAMHAQAFARLQLETDLRRAVEREEFALLYQPVVSLATGTVVGAEALVRWYHPERGLIGPEQFIPAAEETGLIIPLGEWVIAESCRQLARWQRSLPADAPFTLAVNLSAKQFTQPDLVAQVTGALREAG
jgi:diguanylate cyclase (GGDEF)-like protein